MSFSFTRPTTLLPLLLILASCNINDSHYTYTGGWFSSKVYGSGILATEDRTSILKSMPLHAISLVGIGTLCIEEGLKEHFEVIAEDNLLPHISTKLIDGTLTCQLSSEYSYELRHSQGINYRLVLTQEQLRQLHTLHVEGCTKLYNAAVLHNENISIGAQGASKIELQDLITTTLHINAQGAVKIDIKTADVKELCSFTASGAIQISIEQLNASTAHATFDLHGSSKLDIDEGTINSCTIEAHGASAVRSFNALCTTKPMTNIYGAASVRINKTKYSRN